MKRNLPSCALLVLALCLVQCHPPSYHSPQKAAGAQEMIVLQDESPVDVIRARTAPDPTEMEPADLHGEGYLEIVENDFQNALDHPHSTFAIDVDNASYSNIRRLLTSGYPPPIDAVRIEEMINYFNYDYPEPEGEDPFAVSAEVATCPWNPQHRLLQIGIQGRKIPTTHLPPNNLVFLIDASGSMQSPEKLPLLQSALRMLVREMRPQDRVAIVVYAGASGLVLPSTPAAQKGRILSAINALQAGGGTAGAAGIQLAYKVARENWLSRGNNRVILATDGDFNIGVQSTAELVRLIESQRQSGVYLSVLGFGRGNLQDGKMEQLAKHGNGNYAYIDRLAEAEKVLIREMSGTLLTIAKNVKLQLEFNPTQVREYRLIGYENRLLAAEDFNDDRRDAGELGAGHSVTALYEIVPASNPPPAKTSPVDPLKYRSTQLLPEALRGDLLTLKLRYQRPGTEQSKGLEYVVVDKGLALEHSSTDFRFAAAVAGFGLLLRHSPHRGEASWAMVSDLGRSGLGPDPYDLRHEFLTLVQLASDQGVAAPYRDGRRLKAAN
ncbi:MAG: VWA domain-containing protein [Bacteroidota bacterium]